MIVQTQLFHHPGEIKLTNGASLGPITLAYETYGQLNAAHSNAILICHAWSGDAHVAGRYSEDDEKLGWWDDAVGPGKAFDTNKYFVICSNVLGGCNGSTGPASINPNTGKPYALTFPVVTIADMVEAQRLMSDHLGVGADADGEFILGPLIAVVYLFSAPTNAPGTDSARKLRRGRGYCTSASGGASSKL